MKAIISLLAVGTVWGVCTAVMEKSTKPSNPSSEKRNCLRQLIAIILQPRFFIPYALDQVASVYFYTLLGSTPLTLAVPLANCSAFLVAYLLERQLAQSDPQKQFSPVSIRGMLGGCLVIGGVILCASGQST